MKFEQKYTLLFFLINAVLICYVGFFSPNLASDFNALYQSLHAYAIDESPYHSISNIGLNANLNPPIFIMLFQFLGHMPLVYAYIIFSMISVLSFWLGLRISMAIVKPTLEIKHFSLIPLICLITYPYIQNIILGQMGNMLFLMLVIGYYCFKHKFENFCALSWGLIIALKFFPALMLFFILQQKRLILLLKTLMVFTLASYLAYVFKPSLTLDYSKLISHITWYSHSWNLSIWGLVFKLNLSKASSALEFAQLKIISLILSVLLMMLYGYLLFIKTKSEKNNFLLTLCFIVFISPLFWTYYLVIFTFGLISLFNKIKIEPMTILAFILLICPVANFFVPRDLLPPINQILFNMLPFWGVVVLAIKIALPDNVPETI